MKGLPFERKWESGMDSLIGSTSMSVLSLDSAEDDSVPSEAHLTYLFDTKILRLCFLLLDFRKYMAFHPNHQERNLQKMLGLVRVRYLW